MRVSDNHVVTDLREFPEYGKNKDTAKAASVSESFAYVLGQVDTDQGIGSQLPGFVFATKQIFGSIGGIA